jgi:subtilisin family serine protease
VCIIDSGYDLAHPDLSANAVTGENDPGSGAWNVDEDGHGTHVAGTIAAIDNTGVGVVGVAPNRQLRLHIIKVFNAEGWAYSSDLVAAANRCASAGANVISMSLGGLYKSRTEQRAFDALAVRGVLSVAAAGNDANTRVTYPAGYGSVVSVAAVDIDKRKAPFSQYNKDVELAAPGVGVLSSVPVGTGRVPSLSVGTAVYAPGVMQGSPTARASGALADFGLGDVVIPAMAGKVCLIQRGSIDFAIKVANCQASGGVAAVVYNNALGSFSGTVGGATTSIPSVTVSDTDGAALRMQVGQTATVNVAATNHEHWQGTSMATPHVAAVAALVWSYFPGCNASQIRSTLQKSAEDLGEPGRDAEFGFGLVRAKAAYERIRDHGCGH